MSVLLTLAVLCQLLLVVHIWVHCHSLSSERSRERWGDTKELGAILWGCSVHAFGLELGEYRTCEVVFGWSPACADGVDGVLDGDIAYLIT